MRSGQVVGATLLVLALGAAETAEARGRGGGRGGSRGGTLLVSTGGAATAATVHGRDRAEPGLRPVKPVAAPAPLQHEVRATASRCATQAVVGSGAGFCLIN